MEGGSEEGILPQKPNAISRDKKADKALITQVKTLCWVWCIQRIRNDLNTYYVLELEYTWEFGRRVLDEAPAILMIMNRSAVLIGHTFSLSISRELYSAFVLWHKSHCSMLVSGQITQISKTVVVRSWSIRELFQKRRFLKITPLVQTNYCAVVSFLRPLCPVWDV